LQLTLPPKTPITPASNPAPYVICHNDRETVWHFWKCSTSWARLAPSHPVIALLRLTSHTGWCYTQPLVNRAPCSTYLNVLSYIGSAPKDNNGIQKKKRKKKYCIKYLPPCQTSYFNPVTWPVPWSNFGDSNNFDLYWQHYNLKLTWHILHFTWCILIIGICIPSSACRTSFNFPRYIWVFVSETFSYLSQLSIPA